MLTLQWLSSSDLLGKERLHPIHFQCSAAEVWPPESAGFETFLLYESSLCTRAGCLCWLSSSVRSRFMGLLIAEKVYLEVACCRAVR